MNQEVKSPQQKAAKYNAKVAENQATAARNAAAIREQQHREQVRRLAAGQRAGYGGAGVTGEGSPLLVMADTLEQAELDAQRIRYGGEVSATGLQSQARLQRFQGDQYARAGALGAGTTLLSGAATATRYAAPLFKGTEPAPRYFNSGPYEGLNTRLYGFD